MDAPDHHRPEGGFRTPWLRDGEEQRGLREFLRWQWGRLTSPTPPDVDPSEIPRGDPDPGRPRAAPDEIRATWLGHATFLLQVGRVTLLTDPILSERASPFSFAGPSRYLPSPLGVAELPPIDAVVLSHDHFDHLDEPTVRALHGRFGDALRFVTPLGYADWFGNRGVTSVQELDWWESCEFETGDGDPVRVTAAPAQHWTRRGMASNARLWASYAVAADGGAVYFGGDSGYFHGFAEIGRRLGPFDLTLMPIGAYEPRWFMRHAHMNPEEGVRAYRELGGRGAFVGMHWGTFRLTDEPPLEPPVRAREAWTAAGLPEGDLHEPGIGGTVRLVGVGGV